MALNPEDVIRVRAAAAEYTNYVLQFPNVFGCGVGERTVAGRRTGEASLVVYVKRKLSVAYLRSREILPRQLETSKGAVLVDVVERGEPQLCVDNRRYRPLEGGSRIALMQPRNIATGGPENRATLGAVMYDRTDAEVVLLTANHLLTLPGERSYPVEGYISQPSYAWTVGRTKRIVPWLPPLWGDYGDNNLYAANLAARVDAGIVSIDEPDVEARFRVIDLGKHPYVVLPPYPGLEVKKRGSETELTMGTVEETDVTIMFYDFDGTLVRIGGVGSGFSVRPPEDQFFCRRGDSGSLVVDAEGGAARGMVFTMEEVFDSKGQQMPGTLTFCCQLSAIMEELQLETPCTGSFNALFMRALRRRWFLSSVGLVDQGVVKAMSKNFMKFRYRYLQHGLKGSVADALEKLFHDFAHELSEDLYLDDDFAGLVDLAIGDWIVQPTIYDLLEYRLPDDFGQKLSRAFERFHELHPDVMGYEWVAPAFKSCGGSRMRDVLTQAAP